MKHCVFLLSISLAASTWADTHYVNVTNTAPFAPYTNWATAATVIQDAVDAASGGDTVLVADGVYSNGTTATPGYSSLNRVVITKTITVRSVNGPEATSIVGKGPLGPDAVRGVYMSAGALSGFTITNGHTRTSGSDNFNRSGGGVSLSGVGVATNCIITGNSADYDGGGSRGGTLYNCTIGSNTADHHGGGSYHGALSNCTLSGNSANNGGGCYESTLSNCIIYNNTAFNSGDNWQDGSPNFSYCCTFPHPGGTGNITDNPLFVAAGDYHLQPHSPCIDAGTNLLWMAGATDLAGYPRIIGETVDMGAYEYLQAFVDITNSNETVSSVVETYTVGGTNNAWTVGSLWWTNGVNGSNGTMAVSGTAFQIADIPLFYSDNTITVSGTNVDGRAVSDSVVIHRRPAQHSGDSPIHYVATNGLAIWPFTNWTDAATVLQDAVDTAAGGDTVLVADGVYDAGGEVTPGHSCFNRVVIANQITVRSASGPETTFIVGAEAAGGGNGPDAVRGVYMSAGVLSGFTVTNGHTQTSGDDFYDRHGGGVNMHGGSGVVTNCLLTGNSANYGGGSAFGTLTGCTLSGNSVASGGGGSVWGALNNCTISSNTATYGGGTCYDILTDCALAGNSASTNGGGSYRGTLYNCTIVSNSAYNGGGSYESALTNCIVYYNTASVSNNWYDATPDLSYCCTTPDPGGTGNITNDPQFVTVGDFHLQALSPCINAGTNLSWMTGATDLDANPRIIGGTVDMGAYEYPLAFIDITNNNETVASVVETYAVGGTNNIWVVGSIWWTNSANGANGSLLVSGNTFQIADIPLAFSVNTISVCGSNAVGGVVSDSVVIARDPTHLGDSPTHYVATNGLAIWPFTNWIEAATILQDAVDTAANSDTVLVADGVYDTGGAVTPGHSCFNRVVITNQITVRSASGPQATFLVGEGPRGANAVRGVYMSAGTLSGFTVTNGHTQTVGDDFYDRHGGGVNMHGGSGGVTHCTLSGNSASGGGGSYGGTLTGCTIVSNSANSGGGSSFGTLNNSTISHNTAAGTHGGGSHYSTLNNCVLSGNSAVSNGGGSYRGTLNNCTIAGNSAEGGGGSFHGTLYTCTIVGNSATYAGGSRYSTLNNCVLSGNSALYYGGSCDSRLTNCIVYYNTAAVSNDNWYDFTPNFSYCCTTPDPGGTGNITNSPQFVSAPAGDYRLLSGSPCINAGTNLPWMVGTADIDGHPRIMGGTVDMGAYEYCGSAMVDITNNNETVSGDVGTYTVGGTNNLWVVGSLWWTNSANGANGSLAVSGTVFWIEHIPLAFSVNTISVYGSNAVGGVVSDSVVIARDPTHLGDSLTHYVATNGLAIWPYTNWTGAATVLQDAVDAASGGDTVLVADGVYSNGTKTTPGYSSLNRVVITKTITVRSVNGPEATFILGEGPLGASAVRGAYMSAGTLAGFTITNGHTRTFGDDNYNRSGGGVYLSGGGGATNCIISGNAADEDGGGSRGGTLYNCIVSSNTADHHGGGSYHGTLNNCILSGNSANNGGGCYESMLSNCIVYNNTAFNFGDNWQDGSPNFSYSCTTPHPGGTGNITNDPQFVASDDFHLQASSPCIDAGISLPWMAGATDLDGNPRILGGTVDMGVYEYPTAFIDITNGNETVSSSVETCTVGGTNNTWTVGSLWWTNSANGANGAFPVSGTAFQIADIPLAFSVNTISVYGSDEAGRVVSDSVEIHRRPAVHPGDSPIHYVATNGLAIWPYTNWADGATILQDAIDAAAGGDSVLVTNGTYDTGGAVTPGYSCFNRMVITNEITVRSVNGPVETFVVGAEASGGGNGPDAVRGVYMSAGMLFGFTVANGHTQTSGHGDYSRSGGGVNLHSGTGVLTNCTLTGNSAFFLGGGSHGGGHFGTGSYGGTLRNCTISSNSAYRGGGSYHGTLYNCTITGNSATEGGGGSYYDTLYNCTISSNSAYYGYGGGSYAGTLNNCTISSNSAGGGGGSYYDTLTDCTLTGNWAARGGGSYAGALTNCTLSGNSADDFGGGSYQSTLCNCTLTGNSTTSWGGGSSQGTLYNCTLTGNSAANGGGSSQGALYNCTLTGNSATNGGGSQHGRLNNSTISSNSAYVGGGSYGGTLTNCIVYHNTASHSDDNWHDLTPDFSYSCTTPDPGSTGNITNDPLFVAAGDYRLQPASPCIDAGTNLPSIVEDIEGTPRPLDGDNNGSATADMGCFEYLNMNADSDADNLTDGEEINTHGTDPTEPNTDGDSASDYEEHVADTDPLDSSDWFHISAFTNPAVFFQSSTARQYTLLWCANLVEGAWTNIASQTDIMGSGGPDSLTDPSATNPASFYRIQVEIP